MSLYFKSEEDTPPFEEKYLPNVLKSSANYFSHYSYTIIIDRILDI